MPGVFDYYSPIAIAVIDSPLGRVPLWTNVPDLGPDVPPALPFLENLTVDLELGEVPRITATLSPTFRDGQAFINSPLIEWGVSSLEVQFGYSAGAPEGIVLSPVYTGILLPPEVSTGIDVGITLTAQGTGGYSALRQHSGRTFNNKTRLEIIETVIKGPTSSQLAAEVEIERGAWETIQPSGDRAIKRNLEVNADLVTAEAGAGIQPDSPLSLLKINKECIAQGYLSDWAFVWNLVREARCTMTLVENTIHIFPVNRLFSGEIKRAFRLFDFPGGVVGPVEGVFPILSVDSPTNAVYAPGACRGVLLRDITSSSRKLLQHFVNDAIALVGRTADAATQAEATDSYPAESDSGDGGDFYPGNPERSRVLDAAKSEYDAMTSGMGIELEITTLMDPQFFPGDIAKVIGISNRHDATLYGALKVSYTIGASGAEMTVSCISNTSNLGEQFLPSSIRSKGKVGSQDFDSTQYDYVEVEPIALG